MRDEYCPHVHLMLSNRRFLFSPLVLLPPRFLLRCLNLGTVPLPHLRVPVLPAAFT